MAIWIHASLICLWWTASALSITASRSLQVKRLQEADTCDSHSTVSCSLRNKYINDFQWFYYVREAPRLWMAIGTASCSLGQPTPTSIDFTVSTTQYQKIAVHLLPICEGESLKTTACDQWSMGSCTDTCVKRRGPNLPLLVAPSTGSLSSSSCNHSPPQRRKLYGLVRTN